MSLVKSPIECIGRLLATASPAIGIFAGTSESAVAIHCFVEPPNPVKVITIIGSPSPEPDQFMDLTSKGQSHPRFQIRVRSTNSADASDLINKAIDFYLAQRQVTNNNIKFQNFHQEDEAMFLTIDDSARHIWVVTMQTHTTQN